MAAFLARAKMPTKSLVWYVFAIFVTNTAFLRVFPILQIQFSMQYIPFYSALLAQETLLLPKVFHKVRKSRQILILRQISVLWLKIGTTDHGHCIAISASHSFLVLSSVKHENIIQGSFHDPYPLEGRMSSCQAINALPSG